MQYKSADFFKGAALTYDFAPTPYGDGLVVCQPEPPALVAFAFVEGGKQKSLSEMKSRFLGSAFVQKKGMAAGVIAKIKRGMQPAMILAGTPFQHLVWRALLSVGKGKTMTYGGLAKKIGKPKAARAVGGALNKNKIAWAVPCHRILNGQRGLHGYRYGLAIKEKMLADEGVAVKA